MICVTPLTPFLYYASAILTAQLINSYKQYVHTQLNILQILITPQSRHENNNNNIQYLQRSNVQLHIQRSNVQLHIQRSNVQLHIQRSNVQLHIQRSNVQLHIQRSNVQLHCTWSAVACSSHLQNHAVSVSLSDTGYHAMCDSVHGCLQSTLDVWTIFQFVFIKPHIGRPSRGFIHRQFETPNQFNGTTPVKMCNHLLMRVFNIHEASTASIRTLPG